MILAWASPFKRKGIVYSFEAGNGGPAMPASN